MSTLLEQASLVLIPSGYKEDTVYSVIPTDGSGDLSFTRASNGTRINSAGLVEVCPWNMLQQSEQFNESPWVLDTGGGTGSITVTNNYATAPNGTLTADRIQMVRGTVYAQTFQPLPVISGAQYTLSVYLKSLSGTPTISTIVGANVSSQKTLTTEWVKYELTFNATSSTIYPLIALYVGDSATADLLAWGYQLNIGSTAKPYFPTTDRLNVPRLTYQNGGGGCPNLLLEKQSTNLALWSEDLTNVIWILANSTISANSTTSPDGTQNADKLIINNGGMGGYVYQAQSTTSGAVYTGSFFIKAGGVNYTNFYTNISGSFENATINLTTGAITNSTFAIMPTTQNMGNGWYRVIYTTTSGGNQIFVYVDGGATSGGGAFTGNGVDGVFIWGAQLE